MKIILDKLSPKEQRHLLFLLNKIGDEGIIKIENKYFLIRQLG